METAALIALGSVAALAGLIFIVVRATAAVRGQPSTFTVGDAGVLLFGWGGQLLGHEHTTQAADVARHLPADELVIAGATLGLALALVLAAGAAIGLLASRPRRHGRAHTAARWGTKADLASILVRPGWQGGRLVLGELAGGMGRRMLVAVEELHSVFVLGPTQSRKTSALAIPALLEWEGPAVVTSVKRDLLDATIHARWGEGECWVFDPAGFLGDLGASWDPLADVTCWADARELAKWLMEASAEHKELGDATKGFFERRGQRPLAAALWAAALRSKPIGQVRRWLDELDAEPPKPEPGGPPAPARYCDAAEAILEILAGEDQEDAILAFKSVLDETERQRSGSITSAQDALDVFGDENVERACSSTPLSGGQIDPDRLLSGPGNATLYLYAPLHEQDRLRPVFEALIMSVVRTAMERTARTGQPLPWPLLVLLDEAGNVAPLRQLAQLASTGAGQGIQLLTIFQDGAQLIHRYGKQAATVINNHRAKLMLSGLTDPDSLELISRLIGDSAEVEQSKTTGEDRTSTTEHVAYRRLAPPALLRATRPGEGVAVYGHLPPAKVRLRWWQADRELAARAGTEQERRVASGRYQRDPVRDDRRVVRLAGRRRRRRAA